MSKLNPRSGARLSVVQALYDMEISGKGVLDALAEFETFWLGREVDGVVHPPAAGLLPRAAARRRRGAAGDRSADRPGAEPGLAVEAHRGGAARHPARGHQRADVPPRRAGPRRDLGIRRHHHNFYTGDKPGMVNAVLDKVARQSRSAELAGAKPA